jgi:hypothetical protein
MLSGIPPQIHDGQTSHDTKSDTPCTQSPCPCGKMHIGRMYIHISTRISEYIRDTRLESQCPEVHYTMTEQASTLRAVFNIRTGRQHITRKAIEIMKHLRRRIPDYAKAGFISFLPNLPLSTTETRMNNTRAGKYCMCKPSFNFPRSLLLSIFIPPSQRL